MQITTGLFPHMVLQRAANGASDATITGTCVETGEVRATVFAGKKAIARGKRIGSAKKSAFHARLTGLPAGGPYEIELTIGDVGGERVRVSDVLVGDVWICAGQSNMQGYGLLAFAEKPDAQVRGFFMNDEWKIARDPLHELWLAVDPAHSVINGGVRMGANPEHLGTGPGIAFAKDMRRATGVPQGLLACAHGGTSMAQWDPALKKDGSRSLYGATLRRVAVNGGRVAGVIWYQGEAEANEAAARIYTTSMKALISALRKDLGNAQLPFALVQLARFFSGSDDGTWWNAIQEQQRVLPKSVKRVVTVPAIDLDLDDPIHIAGKDYGKLGKRLAMAIRSLDAKRKDVPPIEVVKATVTRDPLNGAAEIVIEFANVVGALSADGQPTGFALADHASAGHVFRTELDGARVRLSTGLSVDDTESKQLHHGRGMAPYCNIHDDAGRPLPVFGPLSLGAAPRLRSAWFTSPKISALLPSAGTLDRLQPPADLHGLGLQRREFAGQFCSRNPEFGARAPEDVLSWWQWDFTCAEAMKLAALIGYDGPIKVWIDGKLALHDPQGANPARMDHKRLVFNADTGRHSVLAALASNFGRAWGIFLRFERLDIAAKELRRRPASEFALPVPVLF